MSFTLRTSDTKRNGIFIRILAPAVILLMSFLASCNNEACKEPMNPSMQILFYSKQAKSLTIIDTFSVYAVKNGEMFNTMYIDTFGLYQINLQLDYTDTISKFFIKSSTMRDTFVVKHRNEVVFVSAECGSRIESRIDSFYYGRGRFGDSISITNPKVDEIYNGKNVEIYID